MRGVRVLLCTVAFLCFGVAAWAQATATIVGTVTDPSGAVIPKAKVTVANPDVGFVRNLETNSAGIYQASSIPIGNYVVTVEAPGFRRVVRTGITIAVGQEQRVDVTLQVGQATQEVTIRGNVPHVQTENAAVSNVVTGNQITQLNLNNRNFVALATLVPGAAPIGLDTSHLGVLGNIAISFNGTRTQYNNWSIDGGNNMDMGSAGTLNTYPSLDSIAEFRVTTSNMGAAEARHAGASITIATKAGTKTFHGDLFEFVRNDKLDSNGFFQNAQVAPPGGKAPKSPYKRNNYGFTIGGPIYIPGVYNTKKEKTFFFWSEAWQKTREGVVLSDGVPSTLERQGDFSQCDPSSPNYLPDSVGSGCTLPTLNGVTYNNVQSIPGFNAQAFTNGQALLNGLVPLPNNGPANWITSSSQPTNWREDQIRIDQNFSDKTHAFFRFSNDAWDTINPTSLWAWSSYDTIKTPFNGPGKSMVFNMTHTFTPTLLNDFVASYSVDHIFLDNLAADSVAMSIDRPSNYVQPHMFPANNTNTLLPAIELCGGISFCTAVDAAGHPWTNSNPVINVHDNVTWVKGAHTIEMGTFFEDNRKNEQYGFNSFGYNYFTGGGDNTTQNALADMFLGRINQYQEGTQNVAGTPVGGYPYGHWQSTDWESFIQDSWKVNRRLTINFGVRYYYYTRLHDVTHAGNLISSDANFVPSLYDPNQQIQLDADGNLIPGTGASYVNFGNGLIQCGVNGVPTGCIKQHNFNLGPRFGIAWDPFGHGTTTIRAGYGLYFDQGNGNESGTEGTEGNPPVSIAPSLFILGSGGAQSGYQLISPITDLNNFPPGSLGASGFTALPLSEPYPNVQQFNFNIQHQFPGNNLLEVAYVGTLGRSLVRSWNFNQVAKGLPTATQDALIAQTPTVGYVPYRGYTSINSREFTAVSSYHSLQANFRHTFGHGLMAQVAYTWSHAIDDSSTQYGPTGESIDSTTLSRYKGNSDLNRTQILSLNWVYHLPFFSNSGNAFVKNTLGGWEFSGIYTAFTGTPITVTCGIDGVSSGIGGGYFCNPIAPTTTTKQTVNDPTFGPIMQWYNPAIFAQPFRSQLYSNGEPGMFGYGGRGTLVGPGRNNFDIALMKNFTAPWFYGEKSTIQFRAETFNTFNHTQFNGINSGCLGTVTFGQPCGGVSGGRLLGTVNSAYDPRQIQFGLKFIF
ncbi:MAG: TonB-dependent receptor [Acidobacteriota bacterium]